MEKKILIFLDLFCLYLFKLMEKLRSTMQIERKIKHKTNNRKKEKKNNI